MQGRKQFSLKESAEIQEILAKKSTAERGAQKQLRGKLRKTYQFYITDFSTSYDGFTDEDFRRLIDQGQITVI